VGVALAVAALISTVVQSAIAVLTYTGNTSPTAPAKSVEAPAAQQPAQPAGQKP
jgi:hypothetical protein